MKPVAMLCACVLLAPLLLGNPNVQVDSGGVPATGTVGKSYSGKVSASKGTTPYLFSLVSGILPTGLSLSSGGDITGTPTTVGIFSFTIG